MLNQAYVSAILGNIAAFAVGTSFSWSSPTFSKLNSTDKDENPLGRQTTSDENSWIGSLLSIGVIPSAFLFGFLADKIGRKLTLISIGLPFVVSYFILAFAKVVVLYYIARTLIGIGLGGVYTIVPMYVGEIAENRNRGTLGSLLNVLITFGQLFSYSIGTYASTVAYNIILGVIPGVYMVLFFFIAPESPTYLVAKNKFDGAEKALNKLRGTDKVANELSDIKKRVEESSRGTISDLFKSKGLIKALVITSTLVALQQLSGINAILFYAQQIFQASGGAIEPEISSIILGAVLFATSFTTPLFVERLGRKMLLCLSAIGMLVSEASLGTYFYLKDDNQDVSSISWLPIVSLVVYITSYNCGFGPLPWAIMGELFPPNVKSIASSFTTAICGIFSFLIIKFFQSIADGIGMGPSFWLFAGFCVICFLFSLLYLIETKGRSLQEIQDILES